MSNYTITLRQLMETTSGFAEKIEESFKANRLPYDDPVGSHLGRLYQLFLAYYIDHEIGFETPSMFCLQLKNRMLYLVDKYGPVMHHSEKLNQIAWSNEGYDTTNRKEHHEDYTDHTTKTNEPDYQTHATGSTTGEQENRSIEDDNPEKGINIDSEFSTNDYATRMNHNKGATTGNSEGDTRTYGYTEDSTFDVEQHRMIVNTETGSFKPLDELIKLGNLTNYDIKFVQDLEPLFMMVY